MATHIVLHEKLCDCIYEDR